MVENGIKIFKLNFDGTFDEISYENIKEVFTIVNILAIYIQKIKTMYIWIGRNATQALKNYISQIRILLKEEFPRFRIIRNITFDMRSEPFEFFKNLDITKDELYEIIDYQEKNVIPILEKIDELKESSDNLIKSEDYKSAIDLLRGIIELAQEIQDDAIVTEQKRLISELSEKFENKQIVSKIEVEATKVEKEYKVLIKSKMILEAHSLVECFIKKYETVYDLSLIPSIKELILKEKKKWLAEQEKLKNNLLRLEKDFKSSLENLDISGATEIFEKGLNLLSNLVDDKFKIKWEGFNKNMQEAKDKVEFIKKFDIFSEESISLKEKYQYKELKSKIKELIKQAEKMDVPEYRSKLSTLKTEIESAEELYKKNLDEIAKLENIIKDNQKNDRLEENIRYCEKIIEIAKSIKQIDLVKNYNQILEQTKKEIKERREFEENQNTLRRDLSELEERFNLSLKTMEIRNLETNLKKARSLLSELFNEEIKSKWKNFEANFLAAKQLLDNIEILSKNGIDALNGGSFSESLEFFEQIINQLQEYNK
ncbi:MAG: hypothetical protein JSV23_08730 [Promethearchaeota archaeon]|nr:MAG: hypothetical protein JSV23_08730 [Candidatus Lokiarchaeota archaeon]